jgi:hypothetical protein
VICFAHFRWWAVLRIQFVNLSMAALNSLPSTGTARTGLAKWSGQDSTS